MKRLLRASCVPAEGGSALPVFCQTLVLGSPKSILQVVCAEGEKTSWEAVQKSERVAFPPLTKVRSRLSVPEGD
jgi:hypothetical protein